MRTTVTTIGLCLVMVASNADAAGCDGILSLTRNLNYEQKAIRIAENLYSEYCEGSSILSNKNLNIGLDTTIQQLPVGLKIGSGSTKEQMTHLCSEYENWHELNQESVQLAISTSDPAINGWIRCKELEEDEVFFSVDPRKEILALGIRRGDDVINFLGIDYVPDHIVCTGPFGANGSEVVINKDTRYSLTTSKEIPITCRRKYETFEDPVAGSVDFLPVTEIALRAEGAAPLVVSLPREEKYEPSFSSSIADNLDAIQNEIASLRAESANSVTALRNLMSESTSRMTNFVSGLSVEHYVIAYGEGNAWPGTATHFVGCGDLTGKAAELCGTGTLTQNMMSEPRSGGSCGYALAHFTCVKKAY